VADPIFFPIDFKLPIIKPAEPDFVAFIKHRD